MNHNTTDALSRALTSAKLGDRPGFLAEILLVAEAMKAQADLPNADEVVRRYRDALIMDQNASEDRERIQAITPVITIDAEAIEHDQGMIDALELWLMHYGESANWSLDSAGYSTHYSAGCEGREVALDALEALRRYRSRREDHESKAADAEEIEILLPRYQHRNDREMIRALELWLEIYADSSKWLEAPSRSGDLRGGLLLDFNPTNKVDGSSFAADALEALNRYRRRVQTGRAARSASPNLKVRDKPSGDSWKIDERLTDRSVAKPIEIVDSPRPDTAEAEIQLLHDQYRAALEEIADILGVLGSPSLTSMPCELRKRLADRPEVTVDGQPFSSLLQSVDGSVQRIDIDGVSFGEIADGIRRHCLHASVVCTVFRMACLTVDWRSCDS